MKKRKEKTKLSKEAGGEQKERISNLEEELKQAEEDLAEFEEASQNDTNIELDQTQVEEYHEMKERARIETAEMTEKSRTLHRRYDMKKDSLAAVEAHVRGLEERKAAALASANNCKVSSFSLSLPFFVILFFLH